MLLAKSGADVTVFDRHQRVGGRSATIVAPSAAGTFRFDMGPTFFLYPRVLADIFAACDLDMNQEVDLIRLDPMYRLVFETGGSMLASSDMAKLAAEVARIAPQDAASLPRFMADNRAKLAAFRPILESPFHGPLNMLRPKVLRSLKMLRPRLSVDQDLSQYFSDERVRLAFSFQSKYLGMSPFRCPSLFTILSFMEYEFGVFHPRGGCGAVSEAMAGLATRIGIDLRLNTNVERVLFDGKRASGLVGNGETFNADAVLINGDFAKVVRALVPERQRPRWRDAKIQKARLSCSTFMLYL